MMQTISMIHSLDHEFYWRFHFGKRYLNVSDFIRFCHAVGLYFCTELELEQYEKEVIMFPYARLVMPDPYARAYWSHILFQTQTFEFDDEFLSYHNLEMQIRYMDPISFSNHKGTFEHPVDAAWEKIPQLVKPENLAYKPWDDYNVEVQSNNVRIQQSTAHHFYHYWQVHQLYQARRFHLGWYRDGYPVQNILHDKVFWQFLDKVSVFHYCYQQREFQLLDSLNQDADGWKRFNGSQKTSLQTYSEELAKDVVGSQFSRDDLYKALKKAVKLHSDYEIVERVRLAESLKRDIFHAIRLIYYYSGDTLHEITTMTGFAGGFLQPYLELLFPHQRNQYKERAMAILKAFSWEYNIKAPGFALSENDISSFLHYVESTNLASLIFILNGLNRANLQSHSWTASETYLLLKSLATFPESLARNLHSGKLTSNMHGIIKIFVDQAQPKIFREYKRLDRRSAHTPTEFTSQHDKLITLLDRADNEHIYLGCCLAIATLVRNFTSHNLVNDQALIQGRLVVSIRAILGSTFLLWKLR